MWLMPSYGRPHAPANMLMAPGGMPDDVTVIVNEDDPSRRYYLHPKQWRFLLAPPGSRFCDAVRLAYEGYPNEPFYGIIDDDYWPVTEGWHEKMVKAAGSDHIAIANNKQNFPALYTCRVMGGELARAIGTVAPGKMRHNYSDDTWARFASDFDLLRPLEDVIVEHRHYLFNMNVERDETYQRGSGDIIDDKVRYIEWLNSKERQEQCERVATLLGRTVSFTDYKTVRLLICLPMQNTSIDYAFHRSFHNTMGLLGQMGVKVAVSESSGGSHIGKSREKTLWQGMRMMPDYTHMLWIDDDMGWEPKLVTRLIASDHEFCAIAGAKKKEPVSMCFNPLPGPPQFHPQTQFLEVRHVGFAFTMLKRGVIEKLCDSYPDLQYNTGTEPPEWALFFDMIKTGDGLQRERLSEDFSFCQRWRDIGGKIWIDPDASVVHVGRKEYTGCPRDGMVLTLDEQMARANAA